MQSGHCVGVQGGNLKTRDNRLTVNQLSPIEDGSEAGSFVKFAEATNRCFQLCPESCQLAGFPHGRPGNFKADTCLGF